MIFAPYLYFTLPFISYLPGNFQFMTLVLWYLLVTAVVLEGFFNWYFDVFIVTDERIIDVDFKNMIYKNITITKIDKIEEIDTNNIVIEYSWGEDEELEKFWNLITLFEDGTIQFRAYGDRSYLASISHVYYRTYGPEFNINGK